VDLLRISRKFWRYRIVTLPIVALTLLGAFYVVAIKAPVYKVSSSYVLINPPSPPTPDEIARNPALGSVNSDNPYTRFSDQSVIVSLLSSSLSSDTSRQQLASQGADSRYTVAPDLQLGYSSLVVEITGVGSTPESSVKTAELVGAGLSRELDRVQASQGVDPKYMIRTQQVVAPDSPTRQVSSTLRPLVAVLAIGAILLLLAISAAEALDTLRTEWNQRSRPEGAKPGDRHGPRRDPRGGKGEPRVDTATKVPRPRQGSRRGRPRKPAPEPTMGGMTGLTQPERVLRALSVRGDGTAADPGELAIPASRLSERTGIKPRSMYAVTSKLRSEGKIERDRRGWWKLRPRMQKADNGHFSAKAVRGDAKEGDEREGVSGNGRQPAPKERHLR
jgi:hypothetical protein